MERGTEAFPDLGRHCEREYCGQLDFLPFACDGCHKVFCKDHRSYSDHDCPRANHKSRIVVVCDTCSASVERQTGENEVVALSRHSGSGDCDPSRKRRLKCPIRGCREKLTSNTASCRSCGQQLCLKHRYPDLHSCRGTAATFKKRDHPSSPPAIRVC